MNTSALYRPQSVGKSVNLMPLALTHLRLGNGRFDRGYNVPISRPRGVPEHAVLSYTEGIQKWVWQDNHLSGYADRWSKPPLKKLVTAIYATFTDR